jgi:hypothetical protein
VSTVAGDGDTVPPAVPAAISPNAVMGTAVKDAEDKDLKNSLPSLIDRVAGVEHTKAVSVTAKTFEAVIPDPSKVIKSPARIPQALKA